MSSVTVCCSNVYWHALKMSLRDDLLRSPIARVRRYGMAFPDATTSVTPDGTLMRIEPAP